MNPTHSPDDATDMQELMPDATEGYTYDTARVVRRGRPSWTTTQEDPRHAAAAGLGVAAVALFATVAVYGVSSAGELATPAADPTGTASATTGPAPHNTRHHESPANSDTREGADLRLRTRPARRRTGPSRDSPGTRFAHQRPRDMVRRHRHDRRRRHAGTAGQERSLRGRLDRPRRRTRRIPSHAPHRRQRRHRTRRSQPDLPHSPRRDATRNDLSGPRRRINTARARASNRGPTRRDRRLQHSDRHDR